MKDVNKFTNWKSVSLYMLTLLVHIFVHNYSWANTSPMAAPEEGPNFTDDFRVILEGHPAITDITQIDGKNLNAAQVSLEPWSDSYWPTYRGLIATRYGDSRMPNTKSWPTHYNFYLSHPSDSYVYSGRVDQLSPAEKYDLLIGDRNWTLTKHMWSKGQRYMNQYGFVPSWTGICHGWAAAAQVGIPNPNSYITVMDVTQTRAIKFNPFDIQALVSYLWSNPMGEDLFTGRRCRNSRPNKKDGRILDGACFDNNPMTWHLGIVNRVGALGKSFVMDSSYGSEVWNYPVDSYKVSYFNPASLEFSAVLEDSVVSLQNFPQDPYRSFRGPQARYIVGVVMDVFYPGAIAPHTGIPSKQLLESERYIYDLELDANLNVVGGEWHSEDHPDFIWLYPETYNPFLSEERSRIDPDPNGPIVTPALAERARAHSNRGRVVAEIVYKILHRSLSNSP